MIVSKKHKFVFISTPKTGSHSMFKILHDNFSGERIGPNFHETNIPSDVKLSQYTVFSTCRNPYERLVALWHSLLHAKDDKKGYRSAWISALSDDSLLTFSKFVAKNKNHIEFMSKVRLPTLAMPQYRWYKKMPEQTIPLHIENIDEEFSNLTFVKEPVKVPKVLSRKHALWHDLKTEEVLHRANIWADGDFEKFGYQKEET